MHTVEKGRIGESAIVAEFIRQGYDVFLPQFGNTSCDMIVVKDGVISRVECKTTDFSENGVSWKVELRQVRSNKTANNVKKFNSENSEILAVYILQENRVYLYSSKEFHGRTGLSIRKVQPIGDGSCLENSRG